MKICFIWYFDKASQVYDNWRDGLRAAIELIEKEHTVNWVIGKQLPEDEYDVLLFWDDSNSTLFNYLDKYHCKKGLFLTTDPHNFDNLRKLDVVYCESEPVYEAVRAQGIHAVKAFGTDTDFFHPSDIEKDIQFFYPATFSPWKLQRNIAYLGDKLLCVGTIQPDGIYDLTECLVKGVKVEKGYFPVEKIRDYYQRAKHVPIPAIHGSERTALEAMSCNIVPEVNPQNKKAKSYVDEFIAKHELSAPENPLTPRQFVIENYSAEKYARDILRGLT